MHVIWPIKHVRALSSHESVLSIAELDRGNTHGLKSRIKFRHSVRLSIHSHFQCNDEETDKKKCLTLHVFGYVYKHMYAYVYTYNHTHMFLGCRRRGPWPWHGYGSPKPLINREKCHCPCMPSSLITMVTSIRTCAQQ